MKQTKTVTLLTPFAEDQSGGEWDIYPRPSLVRDSFLPLNGEWELEAKGYRGNIRVPFPPESVLSGIGKDLGDALLYKKSFTIPKGFDRGRIIVHFGAVDAEARVLLNNKELGCHEGGYLPFSFDATDVATEGENLIEVQVIDRLDKSLPYGKQRKKRGGMWYTPISGIWQSVWLESVPKEYVERLEILPCLSSVKIKVFGGARCKRIILEDGKVIEFEGDLAEIAIDSPENWTPENPKLYNFTLECGEDRVSSYFALRTVEAKDGRLLLNGKPYFFHGLLDQGYFSDGIYTPASPAGYEFDVLQMKKLGFNMLRKHIKIEPEIFYYYCDKYGMAVFQDFVNSGSYSFIIDTALPTIGLKKSISHRASARRRQSFESDGLDTIKTLYNHPSVLYYTIFNEGWGQYDADRLYKKFKSADKSRIFDATSGWFAKKESDVDSHHVYFKPIKLKMGQRPAVLSEFGGYSCKIENHCFNLKNNYGYRLLDTKEELEDALEKLYLEEVLPAVKSGLCAAVLTQLSDVEDETNGLVTYDRQIVKVSEERMQGIAKRLLEDN